jgi:hypothetical protein
VIELDQEHEHGDDFRDEERDEEVDGGHKIGREDDDKENATQQKREDDDSPDDQEEPLECCHALCIHDDIDTVVDEESHKHRRHRNKNGLVCDGECSRL